MVKLMIENYSRVLKHTRLTLEMTQAEVSERANISRNYYSEIETGKKKPSFNVMEKLNVVLPIIFLNTEVDNSVHERVI